MATVPSPWQLAADLLDPPVAPYAHDPVGFARDEMGFVAWSKQREVMEAVRDHSKVAVRACHGVGKTATAAQIVLWFLASFGPSCRVITTAPTYAQVADLLWREIRGNVARAHARGLGAIFPEPHVDRLELGPEWFALGRSTDKPERFQGHHADHLLLIVDEASGVDERIYEAAEGFQTAAGAKMLLIGNPTQLGGQFNRAFTTEAAAWFTVHIAVTDSPNYTDEHEDLPADVCRSLPHPDWLQEKIEQWGESSPVFQVRVMGNFPENAENAVVQLIAVERAQQRQLPEARGKAAKEATLGVDVARFGDDETVIACKHGGQVRIVHIEKGKKDTNFTTGLVVEQVRRLKAKGVQRVRIVVDDDGVGGAVTDKLRELKAEKKLRGVQIVPFRGGAAPREPDEYPNARSELWFTVSHELGDVDLDTDGQLTADLASPTFRFDSKGRRVVESKDEIKKRLKRSPDRGDAVLLTMYRPVVLHLPDGKGGEVTKMVTAGLRDEQW